MIEELRVQDFTEEANTLPESLEVALERDTGQSAAEFIATAEFMESAQDVVHFLTEERGFDTSEVYLKGPRLYVVTDSTDEEKLARAVGAIPTTELFAPPSGKPVSADRLNKAVSADATSAAAAVPVLEGGLPLGYAEGNSFKFACTVGFMGYKVSDGSPRVLTSGECNHTFKGPFWTALATNAGTAVKKGVELGGSDDVSARPEPDGIGVLSLSSNVSPRASVSTWGGGQGAPTAGTPVSVRGVVTSPVVGATVCKSAVQTGWTCGVITGFSPGQAGEGKKKYENVQTNLCAGTGEIGSPGMVGNLALGVLANNTWGHSCDPSDSLTANPYASFIPFEGHFGDQGGVDIGQLSTWEPMIKLDKPVITVKPQNSQRVMSGTLSGVPKGQKVYIKFKPSNGSQMSALVVDGKWSLTMPDVDEIFTFTLWASQNKWSKSSSVSGTLTIGYPVVSGW